MKLDVPSKRILECHSSDDSSPSRAQTCGFPPWEKFRSRTCHETRDEPLVQAQTIGRAPSTGQLPPPIPTIQRPKCHADRPSGHHVNQPRGAVRNRPRIPRSTDSPVSHIGLSEACFLRQAHPKSGMGTRTPGTRLIMNSLPRNALDMNDKMAHTLLGGEVSISGEVQPPTVNDD